MRWGVGIAGGALLLVAWGAAEAQLFIPGVPTSSEETVTVGSSAVGPTASLCGPGNNQGGALVQVTTAGMYATFNGPTVTPDSNDFRFYAGDTFYIRPLRMLRMLRITSTSANVKIQCVD